MAVGPRSPLLLAIAAFLAGSCGQRSGGGGTRDVAFDVGGVVVYSGDGTPLAAANVILTDIDGRQETASTNTMGLWTISGLAPGAYAERYELPGYEPLVGFFTLDAVEEAPGNAFVGRPPALLDELRLRATVAPFGVAAADGTDIADGIGANQLVYQSMLGGSVSITFNYAVSGGYAFLEDGETLDVIGAVVDTAAGLTILFDEAQISGMNAGTGLTTDLDVETLHFLVISADGYTPIHGETAALDATLRFNAVP